MAKPKTYTCGYIHCIHEDKTLIEGECAIVGKRHYHFDCAQHKAKIEEARDLYFNNISNTVVMSVLVKTINNIVFEKKVDPSYLVFAIRHAIISDIPIKNPQSLHYLIDNKRIKQLWEKEQKKELDKKQAEEQKRIASEILRHMPTKQNETTFTVAKKSHKQKGFGDIFGGD